jgi:hypothetical protein
METASENGKELSYPAHANGMNEYYYQHSIMSLNRYEAETKMYLEKDKE